MVVARKSTLQVLVCVVSPPKGVLFAVQKGRADLLPPFHTSAGEIWFGFELHVSLSLEEESLNYSGAFAQGPAAERFIYINSGKLAGQADSGWERRAKLKLGGLPRSLSEMVAGRPDRAVQARLLGLAGDGGPVCASVRAEAVTWAAVTLADGRT